MEGASSGQAEGLLSNLIPDGRGMAIFALPAGVRRQKGGTVKSSKNAYVSVS